MADYFTANAKDYALYLPDGMALLGSNAKIEIDLSPKIPTIRFSIFIEKDSAYELADAGVYPDLEVPRVPTLQPMQLELDLTAESSVCSEYEDFLRNTPDPAAAILNDEAPRLTGNLDFLSPFDVVTAYELQSWAIHERLLQDPDIARLADTPPDPLDK